MRNLKKIFLALFSFLYAAAAMAQNVVISDSADTDPMRSNGKIYVVMVVVITILAGLIIYVIRLDKKIGKLEKENA